MSAADQITDPTFREVTSNRPVPSVSVVIPFRNAAETLPACLRSISRQTLKDHEVFMVDDGSEDASA